MGSKSSGGARRFDAMVKAMRARGRDDVTKKKQISEIRIGLTRPEMSKALDELSVGQQIIVGKKSYGKKRDGDTPELLEKRILEMFDQQIIFETGEEEVEVLPDVERENPEE